MTKIIIKKIKEDYSLNEIKNDEVKKHLSKYLNQDLIESVNGWMLLNEILKEDFNTCLEKEEIVKNECGKPSFKNSNIKFSLSHSHGIVMCGVSNYDIGVDIEKYKEVSNSVLKKYHFDNSLDFIKYHTKKEARAKKLGISIFSEINDLSNITTNEILINQLQFIYSIDIIDKDINIIIK